MEQAQVARWRREINAMVNAGTWDCESFAELVKLQELLDAQVPRAARLLNAQGFSWAEIAAPLGIGRTAAHKRYAAPTG